MYHIVWDGERKDERLFNTNIQAVKAAMGYKSRSYRYFEVFDHLGNRWALVYYG